MKVFIFEDEQDILELIGILLDDLGLIVKGSDDVNSVIDQMEQFNPNLLLIDYWVTGVKSDALIALIRNNAKLKNIPIILISAIDRLEEVAKNLAVDDIIKKPFDITSFQLKIQKFLNTNYA
jgi:two-component system response regulator protein BraR/BceR